MLFGLVKHKKVSDPKEYTNVTNLGKPLTKRKSKVQKPIGSHEYFIPFPLPALARNKTELTCDVVFSSQGKSIKAMHPITEYRLT